MSAPLSMMMGPTGAHGFFFTDSVSGSTFDYNVVSRAIAAGWNQLIPLFAYITVQAGAIIGSSSVASPAVDVGAVPLGSRISLTNYGSIIGKGGAGGNANGTAPTVGGAALRAQAPLVVSNYGTIGGGGGGGGAGPGLRFTYPDTPGDCGTTNPGWTAYAGAGGGGAGQGHAAATGGLAGSSPGPYVDVAATAGGTGSATAAGLGGGRSRMNLTGILVYGGGGGNGGALGAAGVAGSVYYSTYAPYNGYLYQWYAGHSGAGAGSAVVGNSNITWLATGAILGALA